MLTQCDSPPRNIFDDSPGIQSAAIAATQGVESESRVGDGAGGSSAGDSKTELGANAGVALEEAVHGID